jgi:hypothetical protein
VLNTGIGSRAGLRKLIQVMRVNWAGVIGSSPLRCDVPEGQMDGYKKKQRISGPCAAADAGTGLDPFSGDQQNENK